MNKIAIITRYYNNFNYGGLLQAYALQQAVARLGFDCQQISFDDKNISQKLYDTFLIPAASVYWGKWFWVTHHTKRRMAVFEKAIPHTRRKTATTISDLKNTYDAYICGSDQIWNPIWGWIDAYFLSFVDEERKKIAYAASIANNSLTLAESKFILRKIKGFDAISFREAEAIKALKCVDPSFHAEVMPDPTFLLPPEDWSVLASPRIIKEPYILAYFLGTDTENRERAIAYAEEQGKRIVFPSSLLPNNRRWERAHDRRMIYHMGVEEFLSLIKNADLVLTDSFHGSVFSCIFEVPFVVTERRVYGDSSSMGSRIATLMETLGIDRRVEWIEPGKDYSFSTSETDSIKSALSEQRQKGLAYLSESLI